MLTLMANKIFLKFYAKKIFGLTKHMGALGKFFCYNAGCFCLLLWLADIHFGPRLRPN